ncbi:hypothetical protein SBOR_3277 [Sclerotinia borealis F-4128]|uniref:Mitochondrial zinc maintenance protein 1, mitochondrial n=1 Tax=Sclerotinia borealis (strain F-4128) TaxID=1432307 RepID=W9CPF0_SCLBF|nr:hypothetical protein SBOR_3277 [Sclerotinia borealis F-4128]
MASAAYRHLLRATRVAFNGSCLPPSSLLPLTQQRQPEDQPVSNPLTEDIAILASARKQVRSTILTNRSLSLESPEYTAAIAHAESVAKFLTQNLVQGQKTDGVETYKLRIHEHTERGDNDTIKMPDGKKVTIDGKTCKD